MKNFFDLQRFKSISIGSTVANTVVSGTDDYDRISNFGSLLTIKAGAGDDIINNYGQFVKIYGEDGNDKISETFKGGGGNTTLSGGDGDDSVSAAGNQSSISGGAGNDTLRSRGDNAIITGDADSDYIYVSGDNSTIIGGKGDDIIQLSSADNSVIQYTYGDGTDVIRGFDSNDTLRITTSKYFSTMTSGKDFYIMFDNGSIILQNSASKISANNIVTISGGQSITDDDSEDDGISVKNGIVTVAKSFSGNKIDLADYSNATKINASAVTKNISIVGNAKANSLRGGKGNDTIRGNAGNDTLTGGNGKDVFIYSAGKDIITDYVSGKDKIKLANITNLASTVKNSVVSGDNVILTVGSGKLTIKNALDKTVTFLNKNNRSARFTFTEDEGDADADSDSDIDVDTEQIYTVGKNFSGSKIDLTETKYKNYVGVDSSKLNKKIELVGNENNNTLIGSSFDDTLNGGSGNDTLTGGEGKDKFAHSAGNDVITDYTAGKDKIYLINTNVTGIDFYIDDLILSTENGSINIKEGKNNKITIVDSAGIEYTKTYGVLADGLKYTKNNTILTADNNFEGDSINLADYVTTVKTVNASKVINNIEIIGNKLANSLVGGSGADILAGGTGNDTLTGNSGKDIFVYYEGDDIITDYKASDDKIQLDNAEITGYKVSDDDFIFTTTNGTIKILNGTGKNITVIDEEGDEKIYRKNSSANISELVENNSVGEFEFENKISVPENLITYAE